MVQRKRNSCEKSSTTRYMKTLRILAKLMRPCSIDLTMEWNPLSKRIKSATSRATSVPELTATPMSASFNAGASLTPSPTMATISPRLCKAATIRSLSLGETRANTDTVLIRSARAESDRASMSLPSKTDDPCASRPIFLATATAVSRWSPVTIIVRMPARLVSRMDSTTSLLMGSSKATSPTRVKSFMRSYGFLYLGRSLNST